MGGAGAVPTRLVVPQLERAQRLAQLHTYLVPTNLYTLPLQNSNIRNKRGNLQSGCRLCDDYMCLAGAFIRGAWVCDPSVVQYDPAHTVARHLACIPGTLATCPREAAPLSWQQASSFRLPRFQARQHLTGPCSSAVPHVESSRAGPGQREKARTMRQKG